MATPLPATTRGALWMCAAMALFSAMTVLIRMLTDDIPVHEMIFVRGVVSIAILLPWICRGGPRVLSTRRLPMLLVRSALTSVGLMSWIYALGRMQLADAVALHFTLPIFGIVLAMVVLRENVTAHRWIAAAVGLFGALVILRPGFQAIDPVAMIVLFSALAYAGVAVVTKDLVRTESSSTIVFYISAIMSSGFAIPCLFDWVSPSWMQWLMLIGIGVLNVGGQTYLNRALSVADASFVLPFDFLRLPLTGVAAFFLFSEIPDVWTVLGAAIIFGATYYSTWRERRAHQI